MADLTASEEWLQSPGTQREIEAIQRYFRERQPSRMDTWPSQFEAAVFALGIEILAGLNFYCGADDPNTDPDGDEPEEPWR